MKKSEAYIEKISKEFRLSPATAKVTYDAINKYDWECFNSLMGDFDHPEERVAAEKELNKFKNLYSPEFQKVLNKVQQYMKDDTEYNIHEMNKDVDEVC
jgi:hypothetical protein